MYKDKYLETIIIQYRQKLSLIYQEKIMYTAGYHRLIVNT